MDAQHDFIVESVTAIRTRLDEPVHVGQTEILCIPKINRLLSFVTIRQGILN